MTLAKTGVSSRANHRLSRTTMIRDVYRSLLNTGRTYAAFRDEDRELFRNLSPSSVVLDPMSGYGRTTEFCASLNISSTTVETNPPQYLWQVLTQPETAVQFSQFADLVLTHRRKWPKTRTTVVASDDYFPDPCLDLIQRLIDDLPIPATDLPDHHRLALILPFIGRFSCSVPGDNSTHVKRGGICVLRNWQTDFQEYLVAVRNLTQRIASRPRGKEHQVVFADARSVSFGRSRFRSMVTSPPYPNFRDFASMLEPENVLLSLLHAKGLPSIPLPNPDIIGSNFVSGKRTTTPSTAAASEFLQRLDGSATTPRGKSDNRSYYYPYFSRYFALLEQAYRNISKYAAKEFRGFVIVVNNTHRGRVIPVAEVVCELWQSLGFTTSIFRQSELSHVGSKNPRARGVRAKHQEYVVEITRNGK